MPGRNERGDVDGALAAAGARVDVTYRFAANHHNTLEPSATTAVWDGDRLTLYDSTMGVRASQLTVAQLLGIPLADVRVVTHFVGGGFGGKAMVWPHVTLAAMAARHVGRPVKLVAHPAADVHVARPPRGAGADGCRSAPAPDGRLTAIRHEKLSITSPFDDWAEPATGCLLAALRVPELPRRAPADPRQHDDADVHARPGRGGRRVRRSRPRWTSSRTRSGSTRSSCGCATTPRPIPTGTPGRATGWRSACASARSGSAGRTAIHGRGPVATATG